MKYFSERKTFVRNFVIECILSWKFVASVAYGIRCGYAEIPRGPPLSPLVRDEFYTLVRITLERMTREGPSSCAHQRALTSRTRL